MQINFTNSPEPSFASIKTRNSLTESHFYS